MTSSQPPSPAPGQVGLAFQTEAFPASPTSAERLLLHLLLKGMLPYEERCAPWDCRKEDVPMAVALDP